MKSYDLYCSNKKIVIPWCESIAISHCETKLARAQVESFLAKSIDDGVDPLDTFTALSDIIGQAARQWDDSQDSQDDHDLDFLVPIQ